MLYVIDGYTTSIMLDVFFFHVFMAEPNEKGTNSVASSMFFILISRSGFWISFFKRGSRKFDYLSVSKFFKLFYDFLSNLLIMIFSACS